MTKPAIRERRALSASKARILIVEDEPAMAEGLRFNFEQEGYDAVVCSDGPSALAALQDPATPFDLVLLDLMLPGMSGYEICREIRKQDAHIPILVLSSRTLAEDKAHAFDCGTDQYMTKPFALPELLSRVRNLLERRQTGRSAAERPAPAATTPEVFRFGNVQVNFRTFEVQVGEQVHTPTTMEMQLLRYFIENEGAVLSRDEILDAVWGRDAAVTTRTIDNFVMRLRRLIESDPGHPRHIISVRGTGYRFVAESDSSDA